MGSTDFVIDLRHEFDAEDPLFFAHLTDAMNAQIHVLLYIVNDPHSERFDVDRMPDGRKTQFGLELRNLQAEQAAMLAGLAPGQIRRGLRSLAHTIPTFEAFVESVPDLVPAPSQGRVDPDDVRCDGTSGPEEYVLGREDVCGGSLRGDS